MLYSQLRDGRTRWAISASLLCAAGTVCPAFSQPMQQLNPVYVDDSTTSVETLSRVRELSASGNLGETVRVLQLLLDDQGARVVQAEGDDELFLSVRSAVHRVLLKDAALLERYRSTMQPKAERLLQSGDFRTVQRTMLLTTAGLEAALRRAQLELEDARFEAARQTLQELENHPDRTGASGRDAAELLWSVATYVDRTPVWDSAQRWINETAEDRPPARTRTAIAWPAAARRSATTPLTPMGPLNREGMVAKPLWTATIRGDSPAEAETSAQSSINRRPGDNSDSLPPLLVELAMLPTVAEDAVYVNDGTSVTAFDRFTLSPRWIVSPGVGTAAPEDDSIRGLRNREFNAWAQRVVDPSMVSVADGTVVACTGRALSSARNGDYIVTALSVRDGRPIWSVSIPDLDPTLTEVGIRGPAVIHEGVVVVAARKFLPERRLTVLFLIGLDARTGQLLWLRNVGSAGSLPFVNLSSQFDSTVIHEGVAYRMDDLGVLGAYRISDGEPMWVRTMPREAMQSLDSGRASELSAPIVDSPRESLIVLTPDRRDILRISMATGKIASRRGADAFTRVSAGATDEVGAARRTVVNLAGLPLYLLKVGDNLAAVGRQRVAFTPIGTFETSPIKMSASISPRGIAGRAVDSGGKLVVPTVTGVSVIDPSNPEKDAESIALDSPGNIVALDSQVLTVDDGRLHSYLLWDVATRLLRERMTAEPADASPAVTFAELAYRAEKLNDIVPAADAALESLKAHPLREGNADARRRLFRALSTMAAAGLEPETSARALLGPRIADLEVLGEILDRMARCASGADEKIAQILASGRLAERREQFERAAQTYQSILDDPALATATWEGPQVRARADLEATRRLTAIVQARGPSVYAAANQTAVAKLAALGDQPPLAELERLAEQYPLAQVTPGIWARIGRAHVAANDESMAMAAWESGLRAADRLKSADPAVVGELAGELITRLSARNQVRAAWAVLNAVREKQSPLQLTASGQPMDLASIESALSSRLTALARWPRVGAMTGTNAQIIAEASILEPHLEERTPSTPGMLALASETTISLWAPDPGQSTGLSRVWVRDLDNDAGGSEAALIKMTGDAAYFAYIGRSLGVIEKVVLSTPGKAQTAWKTPPMTEVFPPTQAAAALSPNEQNPAQRTARFPSPGERSVNADDLLLSADERTLIAVQRSGRVVAFDAETGQQLWAARTGVSRVYDIDLASGLLVVAGDEEILSTSGRVVNLRGIVQIFDARTGRPTQRLVDQGGHPRWVRAMEGGPVITGTDSVILSIDPASGRTNWTTPNPEGSPTITAWPIRSTLIVQGADRTLWRINTASGQVDAGALEGPRTHLEGTRPIQIHAASDRADSELVVSTFQGLMVYGQGGEIRGVDALGGFENVTPPVLAEGRAITVETVSEGPTPDGQMIFNLYAMDTQGARMIETTPIALGARPTTLMLMDGRIAITAGGVTVVVNAPAAKQ